MRQIVIFLLLLTFISADVGAVVAYQGIIVVAQSDGTQMSIRRHGDEYFRYTTTSDGYLIAQREGIYYYCDMLFDGSIVTTNVKASDPSKRDSSHKSFLAGRKKSSELTTLSSVAATKFTKSSVIQDKVTFPVTGRVKSVVLLVQFSDVKFTINDPLGNFRRMLNTNNYSENFATGSAKDYFTDNSMGRFDVEFDVFGVITLSKKMGYYGANSRSGDDANAGEMVVEACALAASGGVDFSQYDYDSNGVVDNVFIYFAGYNEAEGGSESSIWPHKGTLITPTVVGGKTIRQYACSSELRGAKETVMSGVGTFCHEFGHVLGLADTYDTNKVSEGLSSGLGSLDIMSNGNYNNSGRTPPFYTAFERYQLGWLEPTPLVKSGDYALKPIRDNEAYIVQTKNANEYFMFEFRDNSKLPRNWDAHIALGTFKGMLVTHIDKSQSSAAGSTAAARWVTNSVNNAISHECARVVYSKSGVNYISNVNDPNMLYMIFPGKDNNTTFGKESKPAPSAWNGTLARVNLSKIRIEESVVKFTNNVELLDFTQGTNSIRVDWNESGNSFLLKWRERGVEAYTSSRNIIDNNYTISGLASGKIYEVVLFTPIGDAYKEIARGFVSTNSSFGSYPIIKFAYLQSAATAVFNPVIENTNSTNIKWYLNGELQNISNPKRLGVGDYRIVCEIVTADGIEKVAKYFKVQ